MSGLSTHVYTHATKGGQTEQKDLHWERVIKQQEQEGVKL